MASKKRTPKRIGRETVPHPSAAELAEELNEARRELGRMRHLVVELALRLVASGGK